MLSQNRERRLLASSCLSVRMEQFDSHYMDCHDIYYFMMLKKSVDKIQVSLKSDRITGNLHEKQYTFFITPRSMHLIMRNISDKFVREIKAHSLFNNFSFLELCHLRGNVEQYFRAGQATDGNMAHVNCGWIRKATNTHSEYVILIALSRQKWLHERASFSCTFSLHHVSRVQTISEKKFSSCPCRKLCSVAQFFWIPVTHTDVYVDLLDTITEILQQIKIKSNEIRFGSIFCHF